MFARPLTLRIVGSGSRRGTISAGPVTVSGKQLSARLLSVLPKPTSKVYIQILILI